MNNDLYVGHDAEVFVKDISTNTIVPSCDLVGGTKKKPLKIPRSRYGSTYQEDNVTVEFGQSPIKYDPDKHSVSAFFHSGFRELTGFLSNKNLAPVIKPCHEFDSDILIKHPKSLVFGCDPDYMAYQDGAKRSPPSPHKTFRCAGGHIHFGYDAKNTGIPPHALIKLVEYLAYTSYIRHDAQTFRRETYGIPGLFRPKSYGVEWRTPSNFWLSQGSEFVDVAAHTAWRLINSPKTARSIYGEVDWNRVYMQLSRESVSAELLSQVNVHRNVLHRNTGT